ncbi:MAG: hypothetical protein A2V88_16480 [Elusimicrobia bacterium RBG_16_66_12]|nr:MAG: hypothetical protein A2V88_16480 [Elusimicrobia bacterium RBG_16_66_12]
MRTWACLAATFLTAACAGPRPCTQSLCPANLAGGSSATAATYEVRGWSGTVTISPDVPKPPVPSDSEVSVLTGEAEFTNGQTTLRAGAGTSFRYSVSTRAVSEIEVSSGSVTILTSSAAIPTTVLPGAPYTLPRAR